MSLCRVVMVVLPLSLIGCGAATLPPAQLSDSRAAIRTAEELGAARYPQGALYLKRARDNLERADALAAAGDAREAEWALIRAETDADLAVAVTQMAQARQEAFEAQTALERARRTAPR